MTDDIYVKDTEVKISYDGLDAHIKLRFRDVETGKLTLRLLEIFCENIKKRIENTVQYGRLLDLPSVEYAEYFIGYGNSNSDIIGRQLDYKQLSKEDCVILDGTP